MSAEKFTKFSSKSKYSRTLVLAATVKVKRHANPCNMYEKRFRDKKKKFILVMATPRNNVVSRLRELNFIFLSNGTRSHGQWGYIKQCTSQVNLSID